MKIALVGSAPSSILTAPTKDASFAQFTSGRALLEKHQFPWINDAFEIWACSPGTYGVLERIDRFFELHRWESGKPWFSPEYTSFLREFRGIVYTTEIVPEIKNSTRLNREAIVAEFGQFFLTSSLSLMMAWAIIEIELERLKPEHDASQDAIGMFGVDMSASEEYLEQRSGCHFFFMEAKRRGIQVIIPPESDILRPRPIYGVCEWSHAHIKSLARMRELEGRKQNADARARQGLDESLFLSGAIDNLKYMTDTWLINESSAMVLPDEKGAQVMYLQPSAPADDAVMDRPAESEWFDPYSAKHPPQVSTVMGAIDALTPDERAALDRAVATASALPNGRA